MVWSLLALLRSLPGVRDASSAQRSSRSEATSVMSLAEKHAP